MKTYVLDKISSQAAAAQLLSEILPCENATWLLLSKSGDPVAYFSIVPACIEIVGPAVTADISGRYYNEDRAVLDILEQLQRTLGGEISYAP